MALDVIRTTTSVGASITASGTCSTPTRLVSSNTTALMASPSRPVNPYEPHVPDAGRV